MTVQSSFLIRCTLHSDPDSRTGKGWYVQHVQTGEEHRAATLEEVSTWISQQNQCYLTAARGVAIITNRMRCASKQ